MARNKITIVEVDDEHREIHLNGNEIYATDHDTDGWEGMQRIEGAVIALAERLNIPVERK